MTENRDGGHPMNRPGHKKVGERPTPEEAVEFQSYLDGLWDTTPPQAESTVDSMWQTWEIDRFLHCVEEAMFGLELPDIHDAVVAKLVQHKLEIAASTYRIRWETGLQPLAKPMPPMITREAGGALADVLREIAEESDPAVAAHILGRRSRIDPEYAAEANTMLMATRYSEMVYDLIELWVSRLNHEGTPDPEEETIRVGRVRLGEFVRENVAMRRQKEKAANK